ncbi:MAG TPA: recombinase family protein, partial [Trebonia sp.]
GAASGAGPLAGYARTAGDDSETARQRLALLREAGCTRMWADVTAAGKPGDPADGRPRLRDCLESLRPGDILVVTGLDQLGRTAREVSAAAGEARRRGAGLRSLREDLDTTAPGGEAIFRLLAGLADLGRAAISAGTREGLAAAQARGKRLGRPPALTPEQLREVRELLLRPEGTVSGVARRLGVSRSTLYKYLPDALRTARTPTAHLAPYQARPGRRVLVIDDLADLRGPTEGSVELPLRLFWSVPDHRFDLAEHDLRLWYYQTVLREASRAEDLTDYLDAATLVSLWPELYLPKGVKRAWEEQHPVLGAAVSA